MNTDKYFEIQKRWLNNGLDLEAEDIRWLIEEIHKLRNEIMELLRPEEA